MEYPILSIKKCSSAFLVPNREIILKSGKKILLSNKIKRNLSIAFQLVPFREIVILNIS